ncbi:hypothetical protein HPG69_002360 [Diceros bicornis minor]|uniref:Uncharacterized protein n=1 Tax=Diceros bicornis minor TaxID=77932 RepID=A0A7J7FNM9_DICBM|nr:hypothetical protein HPG69_002360 [Diceros bicornis minor]
MLSQAVLAPRSPARSGHCVPAPARWHQAQALTPASSPCLCSRLALGAQPPRRRSLSAAAALRKRAGAGAGRGHQARPGTGAQPQGRAPRPGDPRSPARSPALEHADLSIPHLSPGKFLGAGPHPPLKTSRSLRAERKPDRDGDCEATILSPVCARNP